MSRRPGGCLRAARSALASLALAAAPLSVPPAAAQQAADPAGVVVFAREGALWSVPADGSQPPAKVAELAEPAGRIDSLRVSPRGVAVANRADGAAYALLAAGQTRRLAVARACAGPAIILPDGARFACPTAAEGLWLQDPLWRGRHVATRGVVGGAVSDGEVAAAFEDSLVAESLADPSARRLLAPHRPTGPWMVSPDGRRAVGQYPDGDRPGTFQFAVDGIGARRRLAGNARPVSWSLDSVWVLLQSSSACVVRAVGGQYRCWDGYEGIALDPSGAYVLLANGDSLFTAPIAGVNAARPTRLVEQGSIAAAWVESLPSPR